MRSREALPTVLYSKSGVTKFSCQGRTEIDSLSWASILIKMSAVWDGSAGLVDEATNVFIVEYYYKLRKNELQ